MPPAAPVSPAANDTAPSLDALRWQCRRGMLELDLLLGAFLEHGYRQLSADEQARFARLLAYPDQTLYDLLMGNMTSADTAVHHMVMRIRKTLQDEKKAG